MLYVVCFMLLLLLFVSVPCRPCCFQLNSLLFVVGVCQCVLVFNCCFIVVNCGFLVVLLFCVGLLRSRLGVTLVCWGSCGRHVY